MAVSFGRASGTGRSASGPRRSVMARAVTLLARRDHSRVELSRKLARFLEDGDDPQEIERVLDELQKQNLLSDSRFAAAFVRQKAARYGDRRLVRDLQERGIVGAAADVAMQTLESDESHRAFAAWRRRFDALPTSAAERGRQGRFLQARGFSMDAIHRVLAGRVETDAD